MKGKDYLAKIAMAALTVSLVAFLWWFVALMFDEVVHDELDQRSTLIIVVPAIYQHFVIYIVPIIVVSQCFLMLLSLFQGKKRQFVGFALFGLGTVVFWFWFAFGLPESVLMRSLKVQAELHTPLVYQLGLRDCLGSLIACGVALLCMPVLLILLNRISTDEKLKSSI